LPARSEDVRSSIEPLVMEALVDCECKVEHVSSVRKETCRYAGSWIFKRGPDD
jgi:hypothetical protein